MHCFYRVLFIGAIVLVGISLAAEADSGGARVSTPIIASTRLYAFVSLEILVSTLFIAISILSTILTSKASCWIVAIREVSGGNTFHSTEPDRTPQAYQSDLVTSSTLYRASLYVLPLDLICLVDLLSRSLRTF